MAYYNPIATFSITEYCLRFINGAPSLPSPTDALCPVSSYPFSVSCWTNPGDNDAADVLGFFNPSVPIVHVSLQYNATTSLVAARNNNQTGTVVNTDVKLNSWFHQGGGFIDIENRYAICQGVVGDLSTSTPGNLNESFGGFGLGARIRNGDVQLSLSGGSLAEVAVWSSLLEEWEWNALGKGIVPSDVRPDSLAFYTPLLNNTRDSISGKSLVQYGNNPLEADPSNEDIIYVPHPPNTRRRIIETTYPVNSSDPQSVDTTIADYRATRLSTYAYMTNATEIQWNIVPTYSDEYYISTYPGNNTSTAVNALNVDFTSKKAILDLWMPPFETFQVRTRMKINGSWTDWTVWISGESLGLVNSFEKYQILNRQTQTIY